MQFKVPETLRNQFTRRKMELSENVKNAINDMFSCSNLLEHMACYQHHIDQLKDWTFVVFSEEEG